MLKIINKYILFVLIAFSYQNAISTTSCESLFSRSGTSRLIPFYHPNLLKEIEIGLILNSTPARLISLNGEIIKVIETQDLPGPAMGGRMGYFEQPVVLINPREMEALYFFQREFVFLHELGHVVLRHSGKVNDELAKRFELEADAFSADRIISSYGSTVFSEIKYLLLSTSEGNRHPSGIQRWLALSQRLNLQ